MLSAEAFLEIVHALGKADSSDPVHKNRRALRVLNNSKTMIYRIGYDPAESATEITLRDISARGCSFASKVKMESGSNFVIQFARNNQAPTGMLCMVVHCRGTSVGYRVGAEFTCSLDAKRVARATEPSDLDRIRNSILT